MAFLASALFCALLAAGAAGGLWPSIKGESAGEALQARFLPDRLGDLEPHVRFIDGEDAGVTMTTGAQGFRGRTPVRALKRPGALRVLCLGDSFTFGAGLPDELAYPALLEKALRMRWPGRRIEVVNAGVPFFNTADALHYYRAKGRKLQADVVVLQFFDDDIQTLANVPFRASRAPWSASSSYSPLGGRLGLDRLTRTFNRRATLAFQSLLGPAANPLFSGMTPPLQVGRTLPALREEKGLLGGREILDEANMAALSRFWEVEGDLIADLACESQADGSAFLAVLAPNFLQMDELLDAPRQALTPRLAGRGVPVLDLSLAFRRVRHRQGAELFLARNGHFNPQGSAIAAHEIASRLDVDWSGRRPRANVTPAMETVGVGRRVRVRLDPVTGLFHSDSPLVTVSGQKYRGCGLEWSESWASLGVLRGERAGTLTLSLDLARPAASARIAAWPSEGGDKRASALAITLGTGGRAPEGWFVSRASPRSFPLAAAPLIEERALPGGPRQVSLAVELEGGGALLLDMPWAVGKRGLSLDLYLAGE